MCGNGLDDVALEEDDIEDLRANVLDDALVVFVQRMGLSQIDLKYSVAFSALRDHAVKMVAYMFPKIKERGYLHLTCVSDEDTVNLPDYCC